jgi:hypothetical protein
MAKKPKVTSDSDNIVYRKFGEGETTWVLNNLSDEQRMEINAAPIDLPVMMQMRDTALREGFVITTKWSEGFGAWQTSLVCNAKGKKNTGLAVSGASEDGGTDSEFVALYKLFYFAEGDLTQIAPSGRKFKRG